MRVDLKDRVVIVTGGGGAIGGAMAEAFAENGAKVVVAGRTIKTLEAVVETIKAKGEKHPQSSRTSATETARPIW